MTDISQITPEMARQALMARGVIPAPNGTSYLTQTNAAMFSLSRQWTHHLATSAGGGPLLISSSGVPGAGIAPAPNSAMMNVTASASYQMRRGEPASATSMASTAAPFGYMLGAKADSVGVNSSWEFGKNLNAAKTFLRSCDLVHMPPNLPHAVSATEAFSMLLDDHSRNQSRAGVIAISPVANRRFR